MDGKRYEKQRPTSGTVDELSSVEVAAEPDGVGDKADAQSIHSLHSTYSPSEHTTIADEDGQHDTEIGLERSLSAKKPIVKVPRPQRRGLFARFAVVAEVTEPTDYKDSTKWFIVAVIGLAAAAAPVGSAIILPTLDQINDEFGGTDAITNLAVALYMFSMAIFPLWWSAFSETSGRRSIYLTSFAMFTVFAVLSAVSKNIAMLVTMRMLSGGAAASVQVVGAGTIADLFETHERGKAMGIFYLGPLCGPLFAPVLGGIVGERWDWRATQWVLVIYGVLTFTCLFFALPETLTVRKDIAETAGADHTATPQDTSRPPLGRTSTREVVQEQTKKYAKMARMLLLDPLKVILYLRYPAVLLSVYAAAIAFGSLYVLNISVTYTFARAPYKFSTLIVGLLYIPNSIGYILSSILGGRWMDHIMKREAKKANRRDPDGRWIYLPEDRMRENAWLGVFVYPAALIWYGWAAEKGVFWLVPIVANFFFGVGSMIIFATITTMLTEFMPQRSSSGVALNNLVRNILSGTGSIVAAPVIVAIGNGWLFTILGVWALSSAAVIWAMRRFGPQWRKRMEKELAD